MQISNQVVYWSSGELVGVELNLKTPDANRKFSIQANPINCQSQSEYFHFFIVAIDADDQIKGLKRNHLH